MSVAPISEYQLVTFTLGVEQYATDIHSVREIIRVPDITPIPRTAEFISGLINLRGGVVAVIDLRKRFDIVPAKQPEEEDLTRILIVENEGQTIGTIVDSVLEVIRISAGKIDTKPLAVNSLDSDLIEGVFTFYDQLTLLINLKKIIHSSELKKIQAAA